jgi:hypothetical protein
MGAPGYVGPDAPVVPINLIPRGGVAPGCRPLTLPIACRMPPPSSVIVDTRIRNLETFRKDLEKLTGGK